MDRDWRTAVGYPIGGQRAERPLLATWVAVLLALVVPVLPLIPYLGYLAAVLVASEDGESAPPFVADVRVLLRRGLRAAVVTAVYLGGPLAVLLVTVYGATSGGPVDTGSTTGRLIFAAGSTTVLTLALVGGYCWPIGLAAVGRDERLRDAFDPTALRRSGTHAAYFVGWTFGATVVVASVATAGLLAATGRPGLVAGALVAAYGSIVACHLWGRALARVRRH